MEKEQFSFPPGTKSRLELCQTFSILVAGLAMLGVCGF
jgi:hypothetical protein